MNSSTPSPSAAWGTKATSMQNNDTVVEISSSHQSEPRSIEGATSEGPAYPVDSLSLAVNHLNIPPCPEDYISFIEDTSLERLVYWKLQGLFENFDVAPPQDILKTVLAHVERPLFALVLKKTKGNQSSAAEVLGCNRNTLHRKLKGFAIQPRDLRKALRLRERNIIAEDILEELEFSID